MDVTTDVCIVGAGAAGLYLAKELSRDGIDVILLEAGPLTTMDATSIGFDPLFESDPYPGATVGRYFGMGGSTSRWGGLLIPHTRHNSRVGDEFSEVWSYIIERVEKYAVTVLSRLGYDNTPCFENYPDAKLGSHSKVLKKAGFDTQASLYLPFRHKNLLGLLNVSHRGRSPRVFYHAVAKDWVPISVSQGDSHIERLVAVSRNGNSLSVVSRRFVIAAGAIESARILLEIDKQFGGKGLRPGAAVGCYLSDHLSIPIAEVDKADYPKSSQIFAPYFEGDWMRGFRFVFNSYHLKRPLFFAHFIFMQEGAGFTLAKEIFSALQKRRMPNISVAELVKGLGGLSKLAMNRFLFSRFYVPSSTSVFLQLDMEQHRVRENRVCLSSLRDEYGRFRAEIKWGISVRDMESIVESARKILSMWPGSRYGLPDLNPKPIDGMMNKPYDAYHPVGTCTMGDHEESVVDRELKVWGFENLWLVSTGVLPTAGTANPTFTLLCLAQYLSENLKRTR